MLLHGSGRRQFVEVCSSTKLQIGSRRIDKHIASWGNILRRCAIKSCSEIQFFVTHEILIIARIDSKTRCTDYYSHIQVLPKLTQRKIQLILLGEVEMLLREEKKW